MEIFTISQYNNDQNLNYFTQSEQINKKNPGTKRGYIQIYSGSGKGKTTAALGLSLRTLLSGGSVFFAQFFKGMKTAEQDLSSWCDRFTLEQYGTGEFISGLPGPDEIKIVKQGISHCREVLKSGFFDLVVMDEVLLCFFYRIITTDEMISILNSRRSTVEVVLTGRKAPVELLKISDLATEMKKIKHYFDCGVTARKGIEY
jgi:cob(I)alamin adenosyltransferase